MTHCTTLTPGAELSGFRLERREKIAEINATALVFTHQKTGAEAIIIVCDERNKTFMIAFRTPPSDDTGVPHIIEHSVLNGSAKYPVKEPFAELLRSSLNTFLNAMTYPDKTVYPVASCNDQDFRNLTDVYLDAVFNPNLSRQTYLQEAWHHDIDAADAPLTYSGVVYNEMKGAYSDPETVLHEALNGALFPDSIYRFSSGGDPEAIPTLSYDAFKEFHRRYYHPSNSRILIHGDVDVEAQLQHLEEFLGRFGRLDIDSAIAHQPRLPEPVSRTVPYSVGADGDTAAKTYLLRAWMLGSPTDAEQYLAMTILAHVLSGTPASPLRKALIDSHLGEDTLNYGFDGDILDTSYAIGLKGTEPDALPKMEAIIDRVLQTLADDGIPPKMVEACVNTVEFGLREANFGSYPKGLVYGLGMLSTWLYDADPFLHLRYETTLKTIKDQVAAGGYFEGLIRTHLLDNPHRATITLVPDRDLEARRAEATATRLQFVRGELSETELADLIRANEELRAAQLRPDPPEALATLPRLPISCIDRTGPDFPLRLVSEAPPQLSHAPQDTRGITYLSVSFDAAHVPQELLPLLPVFAQTTLQAGTAKRDFVDFIQEQGIHTGGINANYTASATLDAPDRVCSRLAYQGKALTAKSDRLVDLIGEAITEPDLDNLERIREICRIAKARLERSLITRGNSFGATRLAAQFSRVGMYRELTAGVSQYHYLTRLVDELTASPDTALARFRELHECLFQQAGMHIHVTGSDRELAAVMDELPELTARLPHQTTVPLQRHGFTPPRGNEAFIVPSTVQYVGKGANLFDLGYRFNANAEVLDTLLSRGYLWDRVRARGGAYGCYLRLDSLTGVLTCMSYRDPNLEETLRVYDAIADYLAGLEIDDVEFEKLIIGAMGSIDTPYSPDQKGAIALSRHFNGLTAAIVQQRREQVLDATPAQLRAYADLFREVAARGSVCVFGGEVPIRAAAHRFDRVNVLFSSDDAPA